MAKLPKGVVAVTPGGALTRDHILGYLAFSSIPDRPISVAKLRKLWLSEGLDENLVPKQRRAVHAFKSACRSVETRRHEGSNRREEIKVDEVSESPEECIYQVTRMVRDAEHRVIEHPKAMRLTFEKSSGDFSAERLDRKAKQTLMDIEQQVREHFERNSSKLPGAKVRAAVRAIFERMGATSLRRGAGGVYFCPRDGLSTLESLQRVLGGLYSEDASLDLMACANADGERDIIERHFTVNVREEYEALMADVATRLRKGQGIRSDRLRNIINRRRALEGHADRYRTLLDSNLGELSEAGRLLDEQVEKLVMQTEDEAPRPKTRGK